jgi:hypothetical protein
MTLGHTSEAHLGGIGVVGGVRLPVLVVSLAVPDSVYKPGVFAIAGVEKLSSRPLCIYDMQVASARFSIAQIPMTEKHALLKAAGGSRGRSCPAQADFGG